MNSEAGHIAQKKQWEVIKEYFEINPGASIKQAEEDLGITNQSIRTTRSQLGIARKPKIHFEQKYKDLLAEHESVKKENAELKKILFCINKLIQVELMTLEIGND